MVLNYWQVGIDSLEHEKILTHTEIQPFLQQQMNQFPQLNFQKNIHVTLLYNNTIPLATEDEKNHLELDTSNLKLSEETNLFIFL